MENFWVLDNYKRQKGNLVNKRGIISTEMVNKALNIAFDAHKGQTDNAGRPYILRILHIADQMQGEIPVCVALLHGTVESGRITFEELSNVGFPDKVIESVKILMWDPAAPYMKYIRGIKESGNGIAVNIKLTSLLYDCDLTKFSDIDDKVIELYYQHLEAMAIFEEENQKPYWRDKDAQYICNAVFSHVIDIKTDAPSIGGRLSNLASRSFEFCGLECGSVEGVLQSFKFQDPTVQMAACRLHGGQAKKAGKDQDWKTAQTLYWMGGTFPRESLEYQHLLDSLYQTAFEQNERFREDLRLSKGYRLLHSIGHDDPQQTILTKAEFISRLERLRDLLD